MENKILQAINNQEYDIAKNLIHQYVHCESFHPTTDFYIMDAVLNLELKDYEAALISVKKCILISNLNYEIYYIYARAEYSLENYSKSYLLYLFSLFICDNDSDCNIIKQDFHACFHEYSPIPEELCNRMADFLEFSIHIHEYAKTQEFLSHLIYNQNMDISKSLLNETIFMYQILLEVTLSEINHNSEGFVPVAQRYTDITQFKEIYTQLKFFIRRIWFHFPDKEQKEILPFLLQNDISCDFLAVGIKYCVVPSKTLQVMRDIIQLFDSSKLKERYSFMHHYINWLTENTDLKDNLREPDYNNYNYNLAEVTNDCIMFYNIDFKILTAAHQFQSEVSLKEYEVNPCSSDHTKFCIIMCYNDDYLKNEALKYISHLIVPDGFELEVITLFNAPSMCQGYNRAMKYSNAKYKLYIHQDVTIIDTHILIRLLDSFQKNVEVGMIGIMASTKLDSSGKWWKGSSDTFIMSLYQNAVLNILESISPHSNVSLSPVDCIDGIFMATSEDIFWREDIFDGWHYYDISQCYEFRRHGFQVCALHSDIMSLMHETTLRNNDEPKYNQYCEFFLKEYSL